MARGLAGHGIGLRSQHYGRFLEERPAVDWLEVVSENFLVAGGRPRAVLEKVRRDYPLALHGVSLSIGGSDALDSNYLDALAMLEREVEPALVSDHLCWGGSGGHYAHDLLPLPYTEEALAHVARRVEAVQERLGRPLVLENVSSYLTFQSSTMSEWDVLSELARRTGCGILLDVNNVYVSARNHGFDPDAYLAGIPKDAVKQIHLAGHTDHGDYVIDTHEGRVVDAVWALYRRAVRRFGQVPSLVEWDEAVPGLEAVLAESERARAEAHAALEAR
jgi:uncharacterized protein (UPF0276 family)